MKYDGKNAEELIKRRILNREYKLSIGVWRIKDILEDDILSLYIPSSIIEFYADDFGIYKSKQVRLRVKEL